MFDTLKSRIYQGKQFIKDLKNAPMKDSFRGYPKLNYSNCNDCKKCKFVCPTGAIKFNPLSIDMGKCTFCGECQKICPNSVFKFSNNYKLGSTNRECLIINEQMTYTEYEKVAITINKEIHKLFSHSLKLRQVCAGGCNGCEMELNACSNVNFDMGRFGIDFVASPRHADGIVITGPISDNMSYALENCYNAIPTPKIVILCGACAISGGIYKHSSEINRKFLEKYCVDLYIPGCPVHPLTFINALLTYLGIS